MTADVEPPQPFLPAAEDLPEVRRLVREGRLQPVLGRVHVQADAVPTPGLRARAVALLVPEPLRAAGAVLGFVAAAWVHAGWTPSGEPPVVLDLVLPPTDRHRVRDPGVRVRQMLLPQAQVCAPAGPAGAPVTTPARTAADLARDLAPVRARQAFEALRAAAPLDLPDVLHCLDRMPRARGTGQARLVVASWAGVAGDGQSSGRFPVIR